MSAGAIAVQGTERRWSLRREWSRAFTIMLVLLLLAAAAAIVGVRGVLDDVRGTARRLHLESVTVQGLRADLVDHEQIAHQLLGGKPVDRPGFVAAQQRISRRFDDAAAVFPTANGLRATVVKAQQSWQDGLKTFGLWGDQV
ncbi:MAG TPA: GGDEF domain-containing protein, partial [Acidimicrobiia bacterium]